MVYSFNKIQDVRRMTSKYLLFDDYAIRVNNV